MNKRMNIHFLKAGMRSSVQDAGRMGHQRFGVPRNGAMDRTAMKVANWLVGNELDGPVLEITLIGPSIELEGEAQLAITGAQLNPSLNGRPVSMYETIDVSRGDVLTFGAIQSGCRAYLAIGGNWQLDAWLGSRSASDHFGDQVVPDSQIKKGQRIEIGRRKRIHPRLFPLDQRPVFSNPVSLRVLPGPEFEGFSRTAIAAFFSQNYALTVDSNRMGYRLDKALPGFVARKEMISSATFPGTIQIVHSGHPVVLMADAQTSGGYPRIATVIAADMDVLAQLKPRDGLRFVLVELEEAQAGWREKQEGLKRFLLND